MHMFSWFSAAAARQATRSGISGSLSGMQKKTEGSFSPTMTKPLQAGGDLTLRA
jgi:hypothetical protein